jgi:hypothetical protein
MGYNENQIKQAELNLKGYAPIVKEYSGFIVLAQTMQDYRGKCSRISRGDKDGFYTIKRALDMVLSEKKGFAIDYVTASAFVDKIASMTEYIEGEHYKFGLKGKMIPVIEYNELKKAAKEYDSEHLL